MSGVLTEIYKINGSTSNNRNKSAKTATENTSGVLSRIASTSKNSTNKSSAQNNGGFFGGLGYTLANLGLGAFGILEGIWDYTAGGIADLFGADDWAEEQFANNLAGDARQQLNDWYNPSKGWQIAGDVASGIGNTLVGIGAVMGATVLSGGTLTAPMASLVAGGTIGLGAAGMSTADAYSRTGELGAKEYGYGLLSGATEGALEGLTSGMGNITAKMFAKQSAKTLTRKTVLKGIIQNAAGEALEEGISAYLEPKYLRWTQVDPNAQNATAQEIGYSAMIGFLSGALLDGIGSSATTIRQLNRGTSIINNGNEQSHVDMLKNFAEYENTHQTGVPAYQTAKQLLNEYESLDPTKKTAEIKKKKLLAQMEEANMVLTMEPKVRESMQRIAKNADAFVEAINAQQIKDQNGNLVQITKEQLLSNPNMMTQFAVSDALGHFLLEPSSVYDFAMSKKTDGVTQSDFRRFQEQATTEQRQGVSKVFGVDLDTVAYEDFIQRIQNTPIANVDVYNTQIDAAREGRAALVSAKKGKAQVQKLYVSKIKLSEGTNVVSYNGELLTITRKGNDYYLFDGKNVSYKLSKSKLVTLLRQMKNASQKPNKGAKTQQAEKAKEAVGETRKREGKLLYVDNDTKRVDKWLKVNRLQLPLLSTTTDSVSDSAEAPSITIIPNSTKNATLKSKKVEKNGKSTDTINTIRLTVNEESELAKLIVTSKNIHEALTSYIIEKLGGREFLLSDGMKAIIDNTDASKISSRAGGNKQYEVENLERIIEKAIYDHSDTKAIHPKFTEFRYYDVIVEIGNESYLLELNVGLGKFDKKYHIYELQRKSTVHLNDDTGSVDNQFHNGTSTTSIHNSTKNATLKSKKVEKKKDFNFEQIKREYENSTDKALVDYAERVINNQSTEYSSRKISSVGKRQATGIKNLYGFDVSRYQNRLSKDAVRHINKGHGESGTADHSMANTDNYGRIGYVLENYDILEYVRDNDGEIKTSIKIRDKNNNPAKICRFVKRVNGYVSVSEAVPDTTRNILWVTSTYANDNLDSILGNKKRQQGVNVQGTPTTTSENELTEPTTIIHNSTENATPLAKKSSKSGNVVKSSSPRIEDFGEKIGGARKDLWSKRGLLVDDLSNMNEREIEKYLKKDNVWKRPDYAKQIQEGANRGLLYAQNEIRKSLNTKIVYRRSDTAETKTQKQRLYVETMREIQSMAEKATTQDDFHAMGIPWLTKKGYLDSNNGRYKWTDVYYDNPVLYDSAYYSVILRIAKNFDVLEKTANREKFAVQLDTALPKGFEIKESLAYSSYDGQKVYFVLKGKRVVSDALKTYEQAVEEANKIADRARRNGKIRYVPKQLDDVHRTGLDYRQSKDVNGDDFIKDFKIKGGEFGNWLSDTDRRESLNYAYDAFCDLAEALDIQLADISFNGKLNIGFGSRGQGLSGASAHYEPLRKVINLTKMNGAGSLAHEWWHSFEDYISGDSNQSTMTSDFRKLPEKTREAAKKLVVAMNYKDGLMSVEEVNADKDKSYNRAVRNLDAYLTNQFSLFSETVTQEQRQELATRYGYKRTPTDADIEKFNEIKSRMHKGDESAVTKHYAEVRNIVDELSDFRKDITGRGIAKEDRLSVAHYLQNIAVFSTKETEAKKIRVKTDFYDDAVKISRAYAKDGGYWDSNCEMLARAFAAYIGTKTGKNNDYLTGHAFGAVPTGDGIAYIMPRGEEAVTINKAFDDLFTAAKEDGLLSNSQRTKPTKTVRYALSESVLNDSMPGVSQTTEQALDLNTPTENKSMEQRKQRRIAMQEAETLAREMVGVKYNNLSEAKKLEVRWTVASGKMFGVNENTIGNLARIAAVSKINIGWGNVTGDAVMLKTGSRTTLYINPNSNRTFEVATIHELTHALKGTEAYAELERIALADQKADPAKYEQMLTKYREFYKKKRVDFTKEIHNDEITAHYVENALANTDILSRLTQKSPSFISKAISWLKTRIKALQLTEQAFAQYKPSAEVTKIEQAFLSAFEEAKGEKGNAGLAYRFAIKDGVVTIDTDQDIFEGVPVSEYGKIAKEYIKQRYKGVQINDTKITTRSAKEYTNSKYTDRLRNTEIATYEAKMRLSTEIENLLLTGEYLGSEKSKHLHSYNKNGFDRYAVEFILGERKFSGEMLIAKGETQNIFYDVVNIKIAPINHLNDREQGAVSDSAEAPSTNSIHNSAENATPSAKKVDKKIKSNTRWALKDDAKITADMSEDERYEVLKDKTINAPSVNYEYFDRVTKNSDFTNALTTRQKYHLLKVLGKQFGVFKRYSNADIELEFNFGGNNLAESNVKSRVPTKTFSKLFSCFDEVIDVAVGIEVHNRNNTGYKIDDSLKNSYVLLSAFVDSEQIIPVKLEVKEFIGKNNTLYVAIALRNAKAEVYGSTKVVNDTANNPRSAHTYYIPRIIENVNSDEIDFLKYVPDKFLSAEQLEGKRKGLEKERGKTIKTHTVLKDSDGNTLSQAQAEHFANSKARDSRGNLQVVYHGTVGEFFAFDKSMRGSNTGTKDSSLGFFFTTSEKVAKDYAIDAQESRYLDLQLQIAKGDKQVLNKLMQRYGYKEVAATSAESAKLLQEYGEIVEKGENYETDVHKVYLNITNPLEVDWEGKVYKKSSMLKVLYKALGNGNDGVIIRNIEDSVYNDVEVSDVFVTFEPNQSKLTTNKNPTDSNDMRYALNLSTLSGADKVTTELPTNRVTLADVKNKNNTRQEWLSNKKEAVETDSELVRILTIDAQAGTERVLKQSGIDNAEERTNYLRAAKNQAINSLSENGGQYSFDGTIRLGDSLGTILAPIHRLDKKDGQANKAFQLYLLHWHNTDRMLQDKPVFGYKVTAEESKKVIVELDKAYPSFMGIAQDVWKFLDNNVQYRVDGGLYSQEYADNLRQMYPHYVPTMRVIHDQKASPIMGKNKVVVNDGKKRAVGGTEDILPVDRMIEQQTISMHVAARTNRLLVDLTEAYEQKGNWSDDFAVINNPENVEMDIDTELTVETRKTEKTNEITFYKDGKKLTAAVSGNFYKGIEAITSNTGDIFSNSKILGIIPKANSLFKKLVTAWNPFFAFFRNPLRDLGDAMLYTRYPIRKFWKAYFEAGKQIKSNGRYWQEAKGAGIFSASVYDYEKGIVGQNASGIAKLATNFEGVSNAIEMMPRLAEYILARESGKSIQTSLLEAQDITTNFGRGGTLTKKLNRTIMPFLNPAIQGFSKMFRAYTGKGAAQSFSNLILRSVLLGLGATALNDLLNEDDEEYESLSDYVKESNYVLSMGNGDFIKIPKGRVMSVLGSLYLRTKWGVQGKEDAFDGYLKFFSQQVTPVDNFSRHIFSPFTDLKTNTTWYGGKIESEKWEGISPASRYDEGTSSIAIWIGKAFNVSPLKVDYLLEQYGGVVADIVLPATTAQAENGIINQNLLTNAVTNSKWSNAFYKTLEKYSYAKNEGDITAKGVVKYLNGVKSTVNDMYAQKREIQSSDVSDSEKLMQTKIIQAAINALQKDAISNTDKLYEELSKYELNDDNFDSNYLDAISVVVGEEYALKIYNKQVYTKATQLTKLGINYGAYYDYYFGVKGKKKSEVIAYVLSMNIPNAQKLALLMSSGYVISDDDILGMTAKEAKRSIANYIFKLEVTKEEKIQLAQLCGLTVKNGRIVLK